MANSLFIHVKINSAILLVMISFLIFTRLVDYLGTFVEFKKKISRKNIFELPKTSYDLSYISPIHA